MKKVKYNKAGTYSAYAVIIIIFVLVSMVGTFNDKEYTITVTDKERIVDVNGDTTTSKYLIFGEDKAGNVLVFQNTDEPIRGKWNSSTVQGSLTVGKTYTVIVVGYRIPFLSCYENIIDFEEVGG